MRTLYLVRHGRPEFPDGEKLCIGWTDLPLSEEGRRQMEKLAEQLRGKKIDKIYTSPLRRCVESAGILSECLSGGSIPVQTIEDLKEINMGDWEGRSFAEIRERYPEEYAERGRDMAKFTPPSGESFEDCQKRALKAFLTIREESRGNVIVLGHAGVNRTLISWREKRPLGDLLQLPQEYGSAYAWEEPTFGGLIVAAGLSSRMGSYKPLLKLGGQTVLRREIDTLKRGGVTELAIVSGYRAEELMAEAGEQEICWIHNPAYRETKMFDSVRLGLSHFEGTDLDGIFFLPVDVPLFTQFTMEYEKYCFGRSDSAVYCPVCEGAAGHPLLIRTSVLPELLAHDGEQGLRGACEKLGARLESFEVPDGGSSMDADRPQEFARLEAFYGARGIPDPETCRRLLRWFQTPPAVVRHCEATARLAVEIGQACAAQGAKLDIELIRSAALLHDLAKGQENHAETGARWLALLGHDKTAEVVADHMRLPEEKSETMNESLIVYLADKRTRGEETVTVEERFAAKIELFQKDPQALQAVLWRLELAKRAEKLVREKGYQG